MAEPLTRRGGGLSILLPIGAALAGCATTPTSPPQDHVARCKAIRSDLATRLRLDLDTYRRRGLKRAEAFRRRLSDTGHDQAVAEGIVAFCRAAADSDALRGRPAIDAFTSLTPDQIARAIRGMPGSPIPAQKAFGRFTGLWYGLWDRMEVDHSWDRIDTSPSPMGPDQPRPAATQFAWVGEAFCWHGTFTLPPEHDAWVILGTVHHVNDHGVRSSVPHVAVAVPGGRLVWITPDHVFLEAAESPDRYSITGFVYGIRDGRLHIKDDRGFQAVYTRSPDDRPAFHRFDVGLAD